MNSRKALLLGHTMSSQILQDFYEGRRSKDLPFVVNDEAKILRGAYASRSGAVVSIDISEAMPKFLIEFGDGTDEIVPLDDLERIDDRVASSEGSSGKS